MLAQRVSSSCLDLSLSSGLQYQHKGLEEQ
jgi:hypothetical protein